MRIRGLIAFLAVVFLSVFGVFSVQAEDKKADVFTSGEFLTWKESSQDFYIEASVGMAGAIATQTDEDKKQAKCISDWYYPNETKSNNFIRSVMHENSGYHPRAIILGILEKQCGKF